MSLPWVIKETLRFPKKPHFLNRPRKNIKLLFVLDEHVEMIWDGLCKAGLEL
jgi:hypothetical protein